MTVFSYHADEYKNSLDAGWMFLGWMHNDIENAEAHWGTGDDHSAIDDIILALDRAHTVMECFFDRYTSYEPYYRLSKLFESSWEYTMDEPPTAEFNMDILLSTMVTAEYSQLEYFVGLVDAYRQSIWNSPFNQEFFAALARGFRKWP